MSEIFAKAGWSAVSSSLLSWLSMRSRVYSPSTLPQTFA